LYASVSLNFSGTSSPPVKEVKIWASTGISVWCLTLRCLEWRREWPHRFAEFWDWTCEGQWKANIFTLHSKQKSSCSEYKKFADQPTQSVKHRSMPFLIAHTFLSGRKTRTNKYVSPPSITFLIPNVFDASRNLILQCSRMWSKISPNWKFQRLPPNKQFGRVRNERASGKFFGGY
jgi:hypothetical protein